MPSQKKLASYAGSPEALLKLDWICYVKATIRSCPLSEEDKVDFVFQHLTGPAREEVKFRPRKSVEDEGENIQDFSRALLDLFDRASRKPPHLITHKEHVLCDQSVDGVPA